MRRVWATDRHRLGDPSRSSRGSRGRGMSRPAPLAQSDSDDARRQRQATERTGSSCSARPPRPRRTRRRSPRLRPPDDRPPAERRRSARWARPATFSRRRAAERRPPGAGALAAGTGGGRGVRARSLALRPRPATSRALNRPRRRVGRGRRHGSRWPPQSALRARAATDGKFDPTILPALVAAGYDRTFEELDDDRRACTPGWRAGRRDRARPRREPRRGSSEGVAVDLGRIGKGFSAARAIQAMRAPGRSSVGRSSTSGATSRSRVPPEGGPWRIAVADPRDCRVAACRPRPRRRSGRHVGTRPRVASAPRDAITT